MFHIPSCLPLLKRLTPILFTSLLMGLSPNQVMADHASDTDRAAADMLAAVEALLATIPEQPGRIESVVGYNQYELANLAMDDPERTNYVYWPYLRKGLPIDFMNARQRTLVHDLLNTALSSKGYLTVVQIMQLEEILADIETTGFPRGTENYTIAIFGTPGAGNEWGWRFEGHHLSLNFALSADGISVTPAFYGASPALLPDGNMAGYRTLRPVHEAGRDLITSMSTDQQAQATEDGNPPSDIISGNLNKPRENWDDWKDLGVTGIAISDLSPTQKDLAQRIIDEVITMHRPEISRSYLAQIDVNDLRFTWVGSTDDGAPHYYRLDGPDFLFEYDLVQGNGNHVHAVWRSKSGDFGGDLLMEHRDTAH